MTDENEIQPGDFGMLDDALAGDLMNSEIPLPPLAGDNTSLGGCGRSESPSQVRETQAVGQCQGPRSGERSEEPLTLTGPGYPAPETAMETDSGPRGGCGREDELLAVVPQVRSGSVKINLPVPSLIAIHRQAFESGLTKSHFFATALLLGVKALSSQLSPKSL
jgi:hypothetical protein